MNKRMIAIIVGLAVLLGGRLAGSETDSRPANGQKQVKLSSPNDKDIEQKKVAIMKIMSQGVFETYIQNNKKFCSAFLKDFKQQKNIVHVKPIVEADNYNDPKLQAYFKNCPNKAFGKTKVIYHADTLKEILREELRLGRSLTEQEEEEYGGMEYRATRNFKLYEVNIDNNPKNGDEHVLYAEGYIDEGNQYREYGGYTIVDLDKCKIDSGVPTIDPFDYATNIPLENYNGIIQYRGKYYVFDLSDDEGRRFVLSGYDKTHRNMNSVCGYRKHTK